MAPSPGGLPVPEGHSVKRLALAFEELFVGQSLFVSSPQGRFEAGAAVLNGLVLRQAEAHGKQLFLGFAAPTLSGDPSENEQVAQPTSSAAGDSSGVEHWLRVHLGLYGSWVFHGDVYFRGAHAIGAPRRRVGEREVALPDIERREDTYTAETVAVCLPAGDETVVSAGRFLPAAPVGQVRVRLLGRHGCADLSGPTACEVISAREKDAVHDRLGPDPLRADHLAHPERGVDEFIRRLLRRKVAVGSLLMDQTVIAGVGNIYRAEALFRAGVDPMTLGVNLTESQAVAIWNDLVTLMADGVTTGVIVTTKPMHRTASEGTFGPTVRQNERVPHSGDRTPSEQAFYVYQRTGQACRVCGAQIASATLQARNLFWCPVCQTA